MRHTRARHGEATVGGARLEDYLAHMTDLLEELQSMAAADPRMALLERILGLALAEALSLSQRDLRPRQPV